MELDSCSTSIQQKLRYKVSFLSRYSQLLCSKQVRPKYQQHHKTAFHNFQLEIDLFYYFGKLVRVQISINDSVSWSDLYTQAGTGSADEAGFTSKSVSLSGYANRVARFRVSYEIDNGSYYPQGSSGIGFYIDNIEIIDA